MFHCVPCMGCVPGSKWGRPKILEKTVRALFCMQPRGKFQLLANDFILIIYLFMVALALHCCLQAFSSCRIQASHCSGFCCWRVWALGHMGSVVVVQELSCPVHAESSRTRDWTWDTCIDRRSLNHWTTREVPNFYLQTHFNLFCLAGCYSFKS